jgi:4-aminobutyrate aminotransferase-like enzyme
MSTAEVLRLLRAYESRNVTFLEADGSWPIVWARARGVYVWDAEGRRYLDLTAAFGVAAAGHANPRVVRAGQRQMAQLLHAMGDVQPHETKARLARELSRLTFERWTRATHKAQSAQRPATPADATPAPLAPGPFPSPRSAKTIFCNSGFEAVEAALKTALLATGKRGIIAFEGGYHGVGYGALNATHREHFRGPFRSQLGEFGHFVPFPSDARQLERTETALRHWFRREPIGAILVEPVQGRGGIRIPPAEFLPRLRELADAHEALLVADEIYTGFGRTGRWFACEHSGTVPDLICLGKALTGGFPLSACVGRADLMDAAWPASTGEAIHTSTFLSHPVGCAMALAQIAEVRRRRLVQASAHRGQHLLQALAAVRLRQDRLRLNPRGLGLMAGVEIAFADGSPATEVCLRAVKQMLRRGFILLPEGEHANVLALTPPLTINGRQLDAAVGALADVLEALG